MRRSALWNRLERVQAAVTSGSRDAQDVEICALHEMLENSASEYYPSLVYPCVTRALHYYCRALLPQLGLAAADREYVREAFHVTLERLEAQAETARRLEDDARALLTQIRSGTCRSAEELHKLLTDFLRQTAGLSSDSGNNAELSSGATAAPPTRAALKQLDRAYREFLTSSLTAAHVPPFYRTLLSAAIPETQAARFAPLRLIFWDQIAELMQMKAVLVNPLTCETRFTRLDVLTELISDGEDTLAFENRVDQRMIASCREALGAARSFLQAHFPGILRKQGMRVSCCFCDPLAMYSDTSASALVGLRVVGDLLDMPPDPSALISAEVRRDGQILPVNDLVAKAMAADAQPVVTTFYVPFESLPVRTERVALRRVATFAEAVEAYYGDSYRQKRRQLSRRSVLKGALGVLAGPLAFTLAKEALDRYQEPVTQCDWQLLTCSRDLYQRNSDYPSAVTILNSLLERFQQTDPRAEASQLCAYAYGELGIIHLQQHHIAESVAAFHHALKLWQTLNDKENQADALLRLGEAYRYRVAMDGARECARKGLRYYEQAHALLHPSMKMFDRLEARYYASSGYMYYWLDEYALAEEYSRRGIEVIDQPEENWTYQTVRQHLGRALIKVRKYDEAFDLLEASAGASVMQSPYYRVRSAWTLGDLYLATGDTDRGLQHAAQAATLCRKFKMRGQYRLLRNMLSQHSVSPDMLPTA